MSGITCEKELAKIKAKAEKRHQQYLKYKLSSPPKKIPLKRDIIASLQKEIEDLKLKMSNSKEAEPEAEPEAETEAEAEAEPEPEPDLEPELKPEPEPEPDLKPEPEPDLEPEPEPEPDAEAVAEQLDGVLPRIEPQGIDDIYPYDDTVKEEINPLNVNKGCDCVLNPKFTLTAILEAIEDYKWRNETIKAFMIHSINTLLIEKGYLPTCVKCLEEVIKRLDYVEEDKHKKKMYIQAVIMIIKMIEIPLRNDVIDKYMSIYTHYRAL